MTDIIDRLRDDRLHYIASRDDRHEAASIIEAQALDLIRVTEDLAKSGSKVITLEMWNNQAAEENAKLRQEIDGMIKGMGLHVNTPTRSAD